MSKTQDKELSKVMSRLAKGRWKRKTKEQKSAHGKLMAAARLRKMAAAKPLTACG